ncbi:Hypothetical protein A7982_04186 [Minicystis rosea]|nr:Hypothetical protein A7982_04186 [Minicystis rosea]
MRRVSSALNRLRWRWSFSGAATTSVARVLVGGFDSWFASALNSL